MAARICGTRATSSAVRIARVVLRPVHVFGSVAVALLILGSGLPASGAPTVIFSHAGATDPTDISEGWSTSGTPGPGQVETGALSPDPDCAGCGLDAWKVDDRSTAGGSLFLYTQFPSPLEVDDAFADGWTLRMRLRVDSEFDSQGGTLADAADNAINLQFSEGVSGGGQLYRMQFGADADGDPIVVLFLNQDSFTLEGAGHEGYVRYELIFRPDHGASGEATLFIDGLEQLSGYVGQASGGVPERISWGSTGSSSEGRGHYNLVEWEIGLPVCFDGLDNDGDGLFDLSDPGCLDDPFTNTELLGTECDDGVDNDLDQRLDHFSDPSCLGDPTHTTESLGTECDDSVDNDGDGKVDLADPTCQDDPSGVAELGLTACDDNIDNDSDGQTDLADAGCLADLTRNDETGELVVNSTDDQIDADTGDGICETADGGGECTLRAAIMQANATVGQQGVQVPAGMFELTIGPVGLSPTAADGDLDVTDDLVLVGAGANSTRIGGDTGLFADRVLEMIASSTQATISAVTIQKGSLAGSTADGGGVVNGGTLILIDSAVSENQIGHPAGQLAIGAGILNIGQLTLINSTVGGNTLQGGGGTLVAGAGIFSNDQLTLVNSTVSENSVACSFCFPIVPGSVGVGIANDGTLTLIQSTVQDNASQSQLSFSGAGIGNGFGFAGTTTMRNSIIAENLLPMGLANCAGTITSLGHNLSDDTTCFAASGTDLVVADVMLGPLADNGGPTQTHLPLAGSPAIDTGPPLECPATDQRGLPRPRDGDDPPDGLADCDIGAVEAMPEPGALLQLGAGVALLLAIGRRRMRA